MNALSHLKHLILLICDCCLCSSHEVIVVCRPLSMSWNSSPGFASEPRSSTRTFHLFPTITKLINNDITYHHLSVTCRTLIWTKPCHYGQQHSAQHTCAIGYAARIRQASPRLTTVHSANRPTPQQPDQTLRKLGRASSGEWKWIRVKLSTFTWW